MAKSMPGNWPSSPSALTRKAGSHERRRVVDIDLSSQLLVANPAAVWRGMARGTSAPSCWSGGRASRVGDYPGAPVPATSRLHIPHRLAAHTVLAELGSESFGSSVCVGDHG